MCKNKLIHRHLLVQLFSLDSFQFHLSADKKDSCQLLEEGCIILDNCLRTKSAVTAASVQVKKLKNRLNID